MIKEQSSSPRQAHVWTTGLVMGMVEVLPGVSGATVAMLFRLYETIIQRLVQAQQGEWRETIRFFGLLAGGMLIGVSVSLLGVRWMLEEVPSLLYSVFFLLIIGTLVLVTIREFKWEERSYRWKEALCTLFGFSLVLTAVLPGSYENYTLVEIGGMAGLFMAGIIASLALILPGMSGALMLMVMGVYELALTALEEVDWMILLTLGTGVVFGIALFSRIIHRLLHKYPARMYALVLGLLTGGLVYVGLQI